MEPGTLQQQHLQLSIQDGHRDGLTVSPGLRNACLLDGSEAYASVFEYMYYVLNYTHVIYKCVHIVCPIYVCVYKTNVHLI